AVLEEKGKAPIESDEKGNITLSANTLQSWFEALMAAAEKKENKTVLGDWIDSSLEAILTMLRASVGSGYRLLEPLRLYHSPDAKRDYAEEVLRQLLQGK